MIDPLTAGAVALEPLLKGAAIGWTGLRGILVVGGAHAICERWMQKFGIGPPDQMLTEVQKLHGKFDAEIMNEATTALGLLTKAINAAAPANRHNYSTFALNRFATLVNRDREALRVWGRWGSWYCLQAQREPLLATYEAFQCMDEDPVVGGFVFGPAYPDIYNQYNAQIKEVLNHPHRKYRTEKTFEAYLEKLVKERGRKEFVNSPGMQTILWGTLRLSQGICRGVGRLVDEQAKKQKQQTSTEVCAEMERQLNDFTRNALSAADLKKLRVSWRANLKKEEDLKRKIKYDIKAMSKGIQQIKLPQGLDALREIVSKDLRDEIDLLADQSVKLIASGGRRRSRKKFRIFSKQSTRLPSGAGSSLSAEIFGSLLPS